jgi:hypothetical protein
MQMTSHHHVLGAALLALALAARAADPAPPSQAAPAGARASLNIGDARIQQAIRETLAETRENPRRHEADVLRGDRWQVFSEQFHEAKVPYCLHPDGLKRQPTNIGPINFVGLYAAPFVLLAKVRGKCI